jgi:plastocyanin
MSTGSLMSRTTCIVTLAATAALAVAGCGGDEVSSGSDEADAAGEGAQVLIADFAFDPQDITVEVGQPVTFINSDDAPHTATADDEKSLDTGRLELDDEGELTFKEAGTYDYFCDFHPFMKGTVEVVD